jgi:glycerophosphoryl diester phosphodiesterase
MEWRFALALCLTGIAALGTVLASASEQRGRTRIAAHRGGALLWPENSLLAFENALKLGVAYLECDVHLTRDDEVVVLHDATLDRTSTGRGAVGELTLNDIRRVRLCSGPEARPIDQAPPTLADLLSLVTGRAQLLVEIKPSKSGPYQGIEERVLARIESHQMLADTLVMAFDPRHLERLHVLHSTVRLGGLLSARQVSEGRSVAELFDHVAAVKGAFVGLQHTLVDAQVMEMARQRGMMVGVWTVNDEGAMRRALELGVDILISDRPDVAMELINADRP